MTTENKEEKRKALRRRFLEDFPFYAKHALRIRTKEGEIRPLVLNRPQQIFEEAVEAQYAAEGKVRAIILKARQQGLSTVIGGRLYSRASQRRAQKAIVVTHHSDSTKALFDMTKRYHDNVPELLKPSTKYSSRRELKFDVLDSGYMVATAGGEGVARGETITLAHLSELAFWPKATARDNLNAILQAIPNTPGTEVYVESTANGVSGEFYELWQGAVKGENGFIAIFIPWFETPEYREKVPANFVRTPDEEDLAERHGLDDAQLMFRRRKVAQNGLDLFRQEYPSTADEAFLTTGRPVFNPEQIVKLLSAAPDIKHRLALEEQEFLPNPRGELLLYRDHDPGETYYIGADVAMGVRGGDFSVAQILDSKKRQVGIWRAHVHPDYFATVLYHLGIFFNTARIAVESNNHGILTVTRLGKDMAYPNFYTETVYDKLTDKETINLGFRTTVKTKPMIIDQLRASLREDEIKVYDKITLRELQTYIVTETGNMEAEEGCFDDCVMALALASHIHEGVFTPIESTDDYYVPAI